MANSSSKINLCLQVPEEEPTDRAISRWLGEPIKTVSVPTSMFLTNKKGYPVLSRQQQTLIRRFVHLDIQIIVRGPARGHDIKHFQQYLEHLYQQVCNTPKFTCNPFHGTQMPQKYLYKS